VVAVGRLKRFHHGELEVVIHSVQTPLVGRFYRSCRATQSVSANFQSLFFPAAFACFHLALAAAAILARPAALIFRLGLFPDVATPLPLSFAQRAFCAAAMRARPAADTFRLLRLTDGVESPAEDPNN
jgi:hypothetical protein